LGECDLRQRQRRQADYNTLLEEALQNASGVSREVFTQGIRRRALAFVKAQSRPPTLPPQAWLQGGSFWIMMPDVRVHYSPQFVKTSLKTIRYVVGLLRRDGRPNWPLTQQSHPLGQDGVMMILMAETIATAFPAFLAKKEN
jgi:hypothetical protein